MTRYHVVTDAETGETVTVPFTAEEEAAADAAPPVFPRLTKRQIGNALIASGMTLDPDQWVSGALSHVENPIQRALALNDWKTAPYYDREHPMFNNPAVLSGVGITTNQIDQLWALAATLPA